jgi:large subunit ribosomal protein L23
MNKESVKEKTGKEEKKEDVVKKKVEKKKVEIKKFEHIDKKTKALLDPYEHLRFVLMTEKSIQLIETQNKMVFVVRRKATKPDIKKAVENAFQTPISKVTTVIDQKGRKKVFIKFAKEGMAGEIAIRLGII